MQGLCAIITNKFETMDLEELGNEIIQLVASGVQELNKVPQVFLKFDVILGEIKFSYYMYMGDPYIKVYL